MKQYVIDELRPEDHKKIKKYLDKTYGSAEMGGIYWLPIATEVLTEIQHEHRGCQPFFVAIDLEEKTIEAVTRNHILCVLEETKGNITKAAEILGIRRMTLYNKLKKYNLTVNNLDS